MTPQTGWTRWTLFLTFIVCFTHTLFAVCLLVFKFNLCQETYKHITPACSLIFHSSIHEAVMRDPTCTESSRPHYVTLTWAGPLYHRPLSAYRCISKPKLPREASLYDKPCQLYKIKSTIHKSAVIGYWLTDLIIQFCRGLTGISL